MPQKAMTARKRLGKAASKAGRSAKRTVSSLRARAGTALRKSSKRTRVAAAAAAVGLVAVGAAAARKLRKTRKRRTFRLKKKK